MADNNYNYVMMMKLRPYILLLMAFFCVAFPAFGQGNKPTLADLDNEILRINRYDEAYEASLAKLRRRFFLSSSMNERYKLSDELFNRYAAYNIDSAMIYANRKLFYAQETHNKVGEDGANLDIIYMMIKGGQLKDASELLADVSKDSLEKPLRRYYFTVQKAYYDGLAAASLQPSLHAEYSGWSEIVNDSIVALSAKPDVWWLAEQLSNRHQNEKAKALLLNAYNKLSLSNRSAAFVAYNLSKIYYMQGNEEQQKQYLIAAAIADIRSSVKEHLALQNLALILFKEGDTKRAYRYMDQALTDAVFCKARLRTIAITDAWPIIQKAYEGKVRSAVGWLIAGIVIVSLLLVLLLLLVFFIRRKLRELEDIRKRLSAANEQLKESNDIKDEYITEFLIQCSAYIDKLDAYRKRLLRLFTGGKRNELSELLKSQDMLDEELNSFHSRFDSIFLGLFPNFIDDFNKLLKPTESIQPKQPGELSTDLRIYALIRLGVTENELISSFLRCSKATVYAYRSRIRLKSIDPEHFDELVTKIGGHA